jgi:hypothetical protein
LQYYAHPWDARLSNGGKVQRIILALHTYYERATSS